MEEKGKKKGKSICFQCICIKSVEVLWLIYLLCLGGLLRHIESFLSFLSIISYFIFSFSFSLFSNVMMKNFFPSLTTILPMITQKKKEYVVYYFLKRVSFSYYSTHQKEVEDGNWPYHRICNLQKRKLKNRRKCIEFTKTSDCFDSTTRPFKSLILIPNLSIYFI